MKKIVALTIAFIAVFSLISCNDCDDCGDNNASDPVFRVRPEVLSFDQHATEPQIIDVITSSDVSWKAEVETTAQGWLAITTEADKVIVRVSENATYQERTGKITIVSDDEALKPAEVVVSQYAIPVINIDANKAFLMFYGDQYRSGLSTYFLILGSGDAKYIEDGNRIETDNGYVVVLNILTEEIAPWDYQKIDLKEGVYKSSMDLDENFECEKQSFIKSIQDDIMAEFEAVRTGPDGRNGSELYYVYLATFYTSLITEYTGGKSVERIMISDGDITVKNDNGNYSISADLISADGEKIIINYTGKLDAKLNMIPNSKYSTYTRHLELSGLDTGVIEFYGNDEDNFPESYNWYVIIDTPGYDDVSKLILSLFSPMTSTAVLDSGSYEISGVSPYEPLQAEAGWAFDDIYGCWVFNANDDVLTDYAPLIEGTVDVANNGDGNYTIEVNTVMDNRYSVKASFDGYLKYTDMTAIGPQPIPPLKISSAKVTRRINEKNTINRLK